MFGIEYPEKAGTFLKALRGQPLCQVQSSPSTQNHPCPSGNASPWNASRYTFLQCLPRKAWVRTPGELSRLTRCVILLDSGRREPSLEGRDAQGVWGPSGNFFGIYSSLIVFIDIVFVLV